jgi:hypothetical protein
VFGGICGEAILSSERARQKIHSPDREYLVSRGNSDHLLPAYFPKHESRGFRFAKRAAAQFQKRIENRYFFRRFFGDFDGGGSFIGFGWLNLQKRISNF